jgi:DNA-binding response OmpR family regulator
MQTSPVILVVDDEPDIVETLDFALRRKGYEVRVAYDGEAALESARSDPPDLMLLDVMMPGRNGYEISREIKEWARSAPGVEEFPVMLVTARRLNSPQREEFVATWSQADDVLYKPFGITRLLDRVNELCPCPSGVA